MNNMNQLLAKAQKLQAKITEVQQALDKTEFCGSAGNAMISVVMLGKGQIKSISINPEIIDKNEKEVLEDLIVAALNDAKNNAEETYEKQMKDAAGGLPIPGMF